MFSSGTEDPGGSALKWFVLQPPASQSLPEMTSLAKFTFGLSSDWQTTFAGKAGLAVRCSGVPCIKLLLLFTALLTDGRETHGDFCSGFLSCTTPRELFRITVAEFFDVATWGYCRFALLYGFNSSGRLQWVSIQITRAGLLWELFSLMRKCSQQALPLQAEDNRFACQYLNVYQVF